jgi:hypothetical protein
MVLVDKSRCHAHIVLPLVPSPLINCLELDPHFLDISLIHFYFSLSLSVRWFPPDSGGYWKEGAWVATSEKSDSTRSHPLTSALTHKHVYSAPIYSLSISKFPLPPFRVPTRSYFIVPKHNGTRDTQRNWYSIYSLSSCMYRWGIPLNWLGIYRATEW